MFYLLHLNIFEFNIFINLGASCTPVPDEHSCGSRDVFMGSNMQNGFWKYENGVWKRSWIKMDGGFLIID